MQKVDGWLGRLRSALGRRGQFLQLVTPEAAGGRSVATRLVLAGASVAGLALAGGVAVGAFFVLMMALGIVYFLLTQVLGVRLDVDPSAFVERAQQYARYRN